MHLHLQALQFFQFTIYVADSNDFQKHQKQEHPAGHKLVDESHPVDSCLFKHTQMLSSLDEIR